MSGNKLTPLQQQILCILHNFEPPWTLTGGGALVGFHLGHRTTRDLDLFWHGQTQLGALPAQVRARLEVDGLEVQILQNSPTFARLRVSDATETCLVDLVAEPVPRIQDPMAVEIYEGVRIIIDTPYEILVNKLCALLSRSELRDLQDVKQLLALGEDLSAALSDAAQKDGGFSPLTLAWVLENLRLKALLAAEGVGEEGEELEKFRQDLIQRLLQLGAPA
jgi:hypothetical protein